MTSIASLSETGALIGEPARTAMLVTLMDGRALTAGELARAAGVTPATASGHLARLVEGGLLALEGQGRHRYFRLASPSVACMIESMMSVAGLVDGARRPRPIRSGPADQAMRRARQCYDHLAGELAVQLADFLVRSGYLEWNADAGLMTSAGIAFLQQIGLDANQEAVGQGRSGRAFCRPCLDWSERRPHVAGAVGRSFFLLFLERDWIRRTPASRALAITAMGATALQRHFEIR